MTERKKEILIALGLLGIVLLAKAPTLQVPYHWDEMGAYVEPAHWLSQRGLWQVLPGWHPAGKFFGHPPGIYFPLAALYQVFGPTVWVSHLFAASFGFLGVYYTYLLGSYLFNRKTGVIAGLLLFGCPVYFAQTGLVLGDVPVTAFGVMCVYYGLRKKYLGYVICSVIMVLMKETSMLIIFCLLWYLYFSHKGPPGVYVTLLKYAVPLLALGLFFAAQKIATGSMLDNAYFDSHPLISYDIRFLGNKFFYVGGWIALEQNRWILSIIIMLDLLRRGKSFWIKPYYLFLLVLIFYLGAFTLVFFLPRYILAVLPYLCLAGARSITSLARDLKLQGALAVLVLGGFSSSLYGHRPGYGGHDSDMQYLDVVAVNRQVCQYVEENFPDQSILAPWPVGKLLQSPQRGYVKKPLTVVSMSDEYDLAIYWPSPHEVAQKLQEKIKAGYLVFHKRFEKNGKYLEIYTKRTDRESN